MNQINREIILRGRTSRLASECYRAFIRQDYVREQRTFALYCRAHDKLQEIFHKEVSP